MVLNNRKIKNLKKYMVNGNYSKNPSKSKTISLPIKSNPLKRLINP